MPDTLPLSRYTVLDLTIARAGPTAVRLLADWGATVIKIEPPPAREPVDRSVTGGRHGPDEQNLHRNKRGLALDLQHPEGRHVFLDLVRRADIVVENFRADVKRRLGIEYETLAKTNPRIILASISGFGQDGPYSGRAGVDQIVQGLSGLTSVTGEPGRGPMRVGIAVSDTAAGMCLGQGILLALLHREQTGRGQWVHTSLLEAMLYMLDFQGARYTMAGEVPEQEGNHHPTVVPMGTFESRDGLVNVAPSSGRMWADFCKALGAEHLLANPDYADVQSRARHKAQVRAAVSEVTKRFTTAELVEKLNGVGVPCGPINTIGEAFEDPQVKHLGMTRTAPHPTLGDVRLIRTPINLSAVAQPASFHHAAPDRGQHTDEILREFGYEAVEIERLREAGAIA
jgi:crotonobetainyl-CoA:carnitine CoA-transferase CaiB-like acyl-CoA transferase